MPSELVSWHALTSEEYNNLSFSERTPEKLYFLTDTKEIYRGLVSFSESIVLYETLPTESIATDKLYMNKNTLEGRVWDGENWLVVIKAIATTVEASNTNTGVTGKAVVDYVAEIVNTLDRVPSTRKVNGKALSTDISLTATDVGASATGHKHVKADITDFPTSMPASDVSAWAKAANKPTYTANEVGAAAASHGTHVSFSTTTPVMDGTATVGTATTVARSDHKHPTDTSRAAASHTHTKSQITDFPTRICGHIAQSTAPSDTSILWIDTANSNVLKFYDSSSSSWKPVATMWA